MDETVTALRRGALHPALHRLEQKGWVEPEWRLSETGQRVKSYSHHRGRRPPAARRGAARVRRPRRGRRRVPRPGRRAGPRARPNVPRGGSTAQARSNTLPLGLLGGAGLALAVVGICGVVGYTVAQRTTETGLRLALGASPGDVLRLVTPQGARPLLVGGVVGVGLAATLVPARRATRADQAQTLLRR